MIYLLMLSSMMAILLTMMNHPLSMGIILLMQTMIISMIMGFLSINFWFSYIMFLIMIGGMLVLFIYMTSVASNEKFKFSSLMSTIMMLYLMMIMMIYLLIDLSIMEMFNYNIETIHKNNLIKFNMNKFLNYPSNIILFLMIIYLFITLIATVKITNIKYGPLRQNY